MNYYLLGKCLKMLRIKRNKYQFQILLEEEDISTIIHICRQLWHSLSTHHQIDQPPPPSPLHNEFINHLTLYQPIYICLPLIHLHLINQAFMMNVELFIFAYWCTIFLIRDTVLGNDLFMMTQKPTTITGMHRIPPHLSLFMLLLHLTPPLSSLIPLRWKSISQFEDA